jgi:hypothetical protein
MGNRIKYSFQQIPWLVALIGTAIVTSISYVNTNDFWETLDRAVICYLVFWCLGYVIEKFLQISPKKGSQIKTEDEPTVEMDNKLNTESNISSSDTSFHTSSPASSFSENDEESNDIHSDDKE